MTLSTKSTTTSELPLRCCTTTLTMAYHHSHSRMLYLLPLLFLLLPHPCITAASWIIASLDYHCLFGPQPLFGLPRYFWITAVSTYQTKQSVTPISAFLAVRPRILRCLQRLVPTIGGSVSIGRNAVKGVTLVR